MVLEKFELAIQKIKDLEKYDEYSGAFIFGSVARGDEDKNSDLDVKVIVNRDNPCQNISHPFINGVKLDLTFVSRNQVEQLAKEEQRSGRIPMIAESIIVFDKKDELKKLKDSFDGIKPLKFLSEDFYQQQFFIYHHDEKVRRNLKDDPDSAFLAMTLGIGELIKIYYRIHGRYKISSKRMLKDLDSYDKSFADLLRKFIKESNLEQKFEIWSNIVDHIVKPMGGRLPIEDNLCACPICSQGLNLLK